MLRIGALLLREPQADCVGWLNGCACLVTEPRAPARRVKEPERDRQEPLQPGEWRDSGAGISARKSRARLLNRARQLGDQLFEALSFTALRI